MLECKKENYMFDLFSIQFTFLAIKMRENEPKQILSLLHCTLQIILMNISSPYT